MASLRWLFLIAGWLLALFGTFFALQGAGVIMWPPESFMLASREWVANGAIIAIVGALLIALSRQIGRRR